MLYLATEMLVMFPNKAKQEKGREDISIPIIVWHQKQKY